MEDHSKRCKPQGKINTGTGLSPVLKSSLRNLAFASAFTALASTSLLAQSTTADVVGTVSDPSGAVIPNATVVLTDVNTHEQRTLKSGTGGEFTFTLLKPSTYSLSATAPGFKGFQISSFSLSAGDRAREDAHLAAGSEGETVNVEATTPALRTDSAAMITTVTERATQELPLNGRNFINLVQVTPGATEGLNNGLASGNRPDDRRQTSSVSVNGQADMMNNQTIDGIDNNERVIGSIGVRPSVDAIQEVSVQTNVFTAEVGRAAGAIINVITKSGTNNFHGTVFEFFRNDKLNAQPFKFGANIPKPKLRQNQYGGSLGGPIWKDHSFFFADYEGLDIVRNQNPASTTVPTLYERQHLGDFTDNPAIATTVPTTGIDKIGQQYFNLFPLPTSTALTNNFTAARPDSQFNKTGDVRGDHRFSNGDLFYVRYTYNRVDTSIGSLFPSVNSAAGVIAPGGNLSAYPGPALTRAHQGHLNYVHTFTPNLLLELKGGYTLLKNAQYPLNYGNAINSAFGQPNINVDGRTAELSAITISNVGTTLGNRPPIIYKENTFQYEGAINYIRGKQIIKIGAGIIRRQDATTQTDTANGNWTFNTFANLLSGDYLTGGRNEILYTPNNRSWEPHIFVQDDVHFTGNLTFNFGVRYDLFTPYTETKNILSNFDITTGTILVAGQNTGVHGGIQSDYSNLAPRFGFAYTPLPKTVIRGGFGLTFTPENTTSGSALVNQPFTATFGPSTPAQNVIAATALGVANPGQYIKFAGGLPTPNPNSTTNLNNASITAALDPHFRSTYIEQFNLTVEREFAGFVGTLSYVGELGRHNGYYLSDYNTVPLALAPQSFTTGATGRGDLVTNSPATTTTFNSLRRFNSTAPGLLGVPLYRSTGSSSYHAFQAVLKRRFSKGLDLQVAYTQARLLDNAESISNNGGNGFGTSADLINTIDYGNGNLDIRSRVTGTFVYAFPFGQGAHGFKSFLIKGWQGNGVVVWNTGMPFSVTNVTNRTGTRPTAGTSDRPNMIASGKVSHPTINKWFDTNAFVFQPAGTVGSEHRNQLYGPGLQRVDLSLFKNFDIHEGLKLEFRTEAFNVLNTAQFVNPSSALSYQACTTACNNFPVAGQTPIASYGVVSATGNAYNPRLIQFAARLKF
jgi:hypothetical protein